jgi:MFS transporter, ACS family, D-galactonate transporter
MTRAVPKPRILHWTALALLVVSICINYADRGNLGVAARSIQKELHLSADQLGILLSAFSITYAVSQLLAGKVIDRWNVNWVYAAAFLLWSGATGLTGLAGSFGAIFALRLILGASESMAYPSYSKIICISFPEHLRGTTNALIDAGSKVGPALGVLLGVKMIEWFSWRGMFLVIGAGSLLWLLPWCLLVRKLPSRHLADPHNAECPTFRAIVSRRALWGTTIGLFGGNYTWFFFLNWLPYYLETERHYTRDRLAIIGSLPFWAVAVSSMLFGMLADWLIRRGGDAGRIRQAFVCMGLLSCCGLMLPAVLVRNQLQANVFLVAAFVALGAWSSNHWALTQLLAGPQAAGKWTGIQNGMGNFAGILGPAISGYALAATHSFLAAFVISCGVSIVGVLGYWIIIGRPAEISWSRAVTTTNSVAYIGSSFQ